MRKLSFIIPLAMAVGQCLAAEPAASSMFQQQAYDQLLSVKVFAFGEVADYGFPCRMTSQGEQCFRTLAESTNGLPLFRAALTNGTAAAKLYALCGIRRLAPEQFDSLAAPVTLANSPITVMVGTTRMHMNTSNLVAQIRRGSYDDFYPPHKEGQ